MGRGTKPIEPIGGLNGYASYTERDDDRDLVFVFSSDRVAVFQYGCWIYTVAVSGSYKLKPA
jgi:hypothetical protein